MKFTLRRHKDDSTMIEATYQWNKRTILAFVIHEDSIEDEDIINELNEDGEITVEMLLSRADK